MCILSHNIVVIKDFRSVQATCICIWSFPHWTHVLSGLLQTEVQAGPWMQISCCMRFTSLGVYPPAPKRDSQKLMFFVVSMFLDEMPAIAAIGTAYKCTDAGCATRVVYIGKAEARSCHQCLVSSLSRPSLLHLPLSVYYIHIRVTCVCVYISYILCICAHSPLFFPLIVNRCAKIKCSDKHTQSRQVSCHQLYKSKQTCEPRLVLQQFAADLPVSLCLRLLGNLDAHLQI